jgi:hypothetical protein
LTLPTISPSTSATVVNAFIKDYSLCLVAINFDDISHVALEIIEINNVWLLYHQ